MKAYSFLVVPLSISLLLAGTARAEKSDQELIAEAESAAPKAITAKAAIKTADGKVLRKGSNGWTCYPGSKAIGPMCNQPQWDAVLAALGEKKPVEVKELSVSYMLAGEGEALGASNTDPFATTPTDDNDWVKEGPHLMILVPDAAILEGVSTNPADPVYAMWKGTPYAHIMVKVGATGAADMGRHH